MNGLEKAEAIQFNGWNFGHIYDWLSGKIGLYPACFENKMEFKDGRIAYINDWVVKNGDGTFAIMSNTEFQETIKK